jgi:hypothetical protein
VCIKGAACLWLGAVVDDGAVGVGTCMHDAQQKQFILCVAVPLLITMSRSLAPETHPLCTLFKVHSTQQPGTHPPAIVEKEGSTNPGCAARRAVIFSSTSTSVMDPPPRICREGGRGTSTPQ